MLKVLPAFLLLLTLSTSANAFTGPSSLPLPIRANAKQGCFSTLRMTNEKGASKADQDLMARRAVVGGLFSLLVSATSLAPQEAEAAKSGGRVGGGFRSTSRAPARTPAASATAASSTTVVQPSVTVIQSSPYGGGYGGGFAYGGGYGYGGMSYGPMLSPGAWIGLTALELAETYQREQRRAEFMKQQLETQRQLGKDQAQIEALTKQIEAQDKILAQMQTKLDK